MRWREFILGLAPRPPRVPKTAGQILIPAMYSAHGPGIACIGTATFDTKKVMLARFWRIKMGNNPVSWQDSMIFDFHCANVARIAVRTNSMDSIE